MKLMLLTAGLGTRFHPHTLKKAKPALPFLNLPMAFYSISWAQELGLEMICANTHHLPNSIVSALNPIQKKIPVRISHEEKIQGSGGGLGQARSFFESESTFVMMNGDEVFLPSIKGQLLQALEQHQNSNALMTILVQEHAEVGKRFGGVWVDQENQVLGFGKTAFPQAQRAWHYIGTLLLSPRIFNFIQPGLELNIFYDVAVRALAAKEKIKIFQVKGYWHETGSLPDYLAATAEALNFLSHENSSEGLFLKNLLDEYSPGWSYSTAGDAHLLLAAGAKLHHMSRVRGFFVGGKDSFSDGRGEIENLVLDEGSHLHNENPLRNQLILESSRDS